MLYRTVLLASMTIGLVAPAAQAVPQADVCYGPTVSQLGNSQPTTNATIFTCPQAGNHTIPELAQAGWQVVQMSPISLPNSNMADQLIIQKP